LKLIKALYRGAALLILMNHAVLTPQEVDELFVIMHQMVKDGHGLIFNLALIYMKLSRSATVSQSCAMAAKSARVQHLKPQTGTCHIGWSP